ncbi:MAG: MarR family winged helix-turn-helix transcriptional regulator [candidate division NC10 bacterium]|nr:MarR family winged helix-turn-helix transcriptional regulator [candidate division NC10 bacterium]
MNRGAGLMKKVGNTVEQQMGKCAEEAPLCACFNIRKAARAITQLYDDVLRPSGLRVTQFSILAVTRRLGPVTVTRLAEETVTDRTTLTRNLTLLAQQGLVRVTPGRDRREREVTLTDRGRTALAQAYPFWKGVQAQVAQGLGPERFRRLLSDLRATVALARRGNFS